MNNQTEQQFNGVIASFNLSPRGSYEGLILKLQDGDKVIQLNFPPDTGSSVAGAVARGDKVIVTALAADEKRHSDHHPVFELHSIMGPSGKSVVLTNSDRRTPIEIKGIVAHINYAKSGEANGVILETSEFIHLDPYGAKAVKLIVGQQLDIIGHGRPMMPAGSILVEAEMVNGVHLQEPKKNNSTHKPDHHYPPGHKRHMVGS